MSVLISRCAWHRRYHGYSKLIGITLWQGLHVSFTDGICHNCAERVRAEHLHPRIARRRFVDRRRGVWVPGVAAVTLTLVVALVLVAHPTHEPPPPVTATLPAIVAADRAADVTVAPAPSPQPRQSPSPAVARTRPVSAAKVRVATTPASVPPRAAVRLTPAVFRGPVSPERFQSP